MTRRKSTLACAALALTLCAMSLTACGQKVGSTGDEADPNALTYWSSWSEGEPQQKIFADAIADFEKESGINVDVRWLGREASTNINNANAVGDGPDLYDSGTDSLPDFRSKDGVSNVDDLLDETIPGDEVKVSDVLPPSVIAASSDESGLGLIPYTMISTAMWFNAAAHPEWVDAPPATFDDFLASAQKIKADGAVPIAQDGSINFYNAYWFYWLQMRHGGPGSLSALGGSAEAWDDPSVLAAARDIERLADAQLFQDAFLGTKFPEAQNAWAQGKYTFNLNGTWLASEVAPNLAGGVTPQTFVFPAVDGGSDTVEIGALGWTVNNKAKNPDAAKDFILFALQKKYIERISTQALNISARSDIDAPAPLTSLQQKLISAKTVNKTYDAAPGQYAGWWSDVFLPLDDKLLSGEISAEQFVTQGKTQTASYIAAAK